MKAGPSRGGATRPENRVSARSKLPQKKCVGLAFPTNWQRDAVNTLSTWTRIRQKRFAYAGSYEWCSVSSSNRVGVGISTGIDHILDGRSISRRVAMSWL